MFKRLTLNPFWIIPPLTRVGRSRLKVRQFERNFVCANPEVIDNWNGPQCIWLSANYNVEGLDHLDLERYDKKPVRIVGVFSAERRGHLYQYVNEIVQTEVVVTGVHSAGRTKLE